LAKGRVGTVVKVASVDEFDEIEFQAARTGNHARAASRMDELAAQAGPSYRAEAYLRAGDQWSMAGEAQLAVNDFRTAVEDGGPTSADPRVYLTRALLDLGQEAEAEALLAQVRAERDTVTPRTCDILAEILTEQGDLRGALEWATVGVEHCIEHEDDAELQMLLRLRYRIRVDLGMDEDDYDKMLDTNSLGG
jgi:tetratricopeptide (TPR) repeat protein